MTLAQWMRDSLGDAPDAAYVQYEGRYRIVVPCRQEEYSSDQIRQAPLSAAERRDARQAIVADETAEQWRARREGQRHGIAPAWEGRDGRGLEETAPTGQCGQSD